jgi:hypothetical protein
VLGVSRVFDVSLRALHGRVLTALDADNRCVLDGKLSEVLSPYGANGLVGSRVRIGEQGYTVVGVLAHARKPAHEPRSTKPRSCRRDRTCLEQTVAFAIGASAPLRLQALPTWRESS